MEEVGTMNNKIWAFSDEILEQFPDFKHLVLTANDADFEFVLYLLDRLKIKISNRIAVNRRRHDIQKDNIVWLIK